MEKSARKSAQNLQVTCAEFAIFLRRILTTPVSTINFVCTHAWRQPQHSSDALSAMLVSMPHQMCRKCMPV